MKVCCSGSTQQATWRGGYETYDWSDHVLISSLLEISQGGVERERRDAGEIIERERERESKGKRSKIQNVNLK